MLLGYGPGASTRSPGRAASVATSSRAAVRCSGTEPDAARAGLQGAAAANKHAQRIRGCSWPSDRRCYRVPSAALRCKGGLLFLQPPAPACQLRVLQLAFHRRALDRVPWGRRSSGHARNPTAYRCAACWRCRSGCDSVCGSVWVR